MATEYRGLLGVNVVDSIRLIAFGMVFALFFGILFMSLRMFVRGGMIRTILDVINVVLDSIPEPIYIVMVFVFAFFATLHWNWTIPGLFPLSVPRWNDTFAPAIAIAIPSALYLQRVLFLAFEDQMNADYVMTARAKGATNKRVVFRHIWPNLVTTVIIQFPIIVGLILSSVFFAEFFFGYQGLYFRLTALVGWGMMGPNINQATMLPIPVQHYETGAAWIAGLLLMTVWFFADVSSHIIRSTRRFSQIEMAPVGTRNKVDWRWVLAGGIPIAIILLASTFPQIFTNQNPLTKHLVTPPDFNIPPFPPSKAHPFGTDAEGRDMLARTLYGTFNVVGVAGAIALIVTFVSLVVSVVLAAGETKWWVMGARRIGKITASLPTFLLLFFVLFQRNITSRHQTIVYILWLCTFELGRSVFSFWGSIEEWRKFTFVEGAVSIGRSSFGIVTRSLGPWLQRFAIEFLFAEFGRVISLMTILAMFSLYPAADVEHVTLLDGTGTNAVQSLHISWLAEIGDWANQVGGILSYPYLIYGPLAGLLAMMIGAGLIARGIRGHQ